MVLIVFQCSVAGHEMLRHRNCTTYNPVFDWYLYLFTTVKLGTVKLVTVLKPVTVKLVTVNKNRNLVLVWLCYSLPLTPVFFNTRFL